MKISIITPSYNGSRFLRKCLESVQIQEGVEWEHIIQDAGSTDGTLEVLKEFPHLQVYSEKDLGMSDGINRGVLKATGDWWMWLNTDDYLLPGALKKVAEFVAANPGADVAYGNWNFVDAESKLIKRSKVFPFDLGMMIHMGCYIASTASFFKKESTVAKGELLNIRFRQVMDQEYFARLGRIGLKFHHIPCTLAEFRFYGDNTSTRYTGKKDIDSILCRQIQFAEGNAVRRCYGFSVSKDNPMSNGVSDALLWMYYKVKKVLVKVVHGCYL